MNARIATSITVIAAAATCAVPSAFAQYDVLQFDVNGLQGQFYDAPGGAAGGGAASSGLDPSGSGAFGGSSPFSGSLEFDVSFAASLGSPVGGNNTGSFIGPFAPAGNPGLLAAAGGFIDFSAGLIVGGNISFSNDLGDMVLATIDPVGSPLSFAFGAYSFDSLLDTADVIDAGGDGFFGDPANGVDISKFLSGASAYGAMVVPTLASNGSAVDWDVVIAVPGPSSVLLLGMGLTVGFRRRRR